MNEFKKLAQIHADHGTSWAAFRTAIADCRDIATEISRRIAEDQRRTAERLEELQEIIADDDRSETARRMARIEYERLKGLTFQPTAAELEAYKVELEIAQTALKDVRQLQTDFRSAYEAAESELKGLRKDVLGNTMMTVVDNWISSAEQTFSRLCEGVGDNG